MYYNTSTDNEEILFVVSLHRICVASGTHNIPIEMDQTEASVRFFPQMASIDRNRF